MISRVFLLCLLVILTMGSSCNSDTLFRSDFDSNTINQPPAQSQPVGTIAVEGGIVVATLPGLPSVKGVRLDPHTGAGEPRLLCNLVQHPPNGTYEFSVALFFPSTSGGNLTIAFERVPEVLLPGTAPKALVVGADDRIMHLDLAGDDVVIDDDPTTKFGTFPRDQLFTVQVTLKLDASPSAHIVLSGAGASGEATRNLRRGDLPVALSFGAVRFKTVQLADEQKFYATNILVKRKS